MLLEAFFGVIYLLLAAGGLVGTLEALSYPAAQREAARDRWLAYLGAVVLATLVGVAGLAWTALGGSELWVNTLAIGGVALLVPLVQWHLHRAIDVERSPLWDRFE